jgi:hypothetical protein
VKFLLRCLLLLVLVAGVSGMTCTRGTPTPTPQEKPTTKVGYFKERFGDIVFPHGQIDLSTVKETPEGVEYQTEDGKKWKVSMTKEGGTYRFGTPERAP